MEKSIESIDIRLAQVLAAKQQLKQAQTEAGQLVAEIIIEKREIHFVPSEMWQSRIDAGDELALEQAVDDEGVGQISYDNDDVMSGNARVLGLKYDNDVVMVDIQDSRTGVRSWINMDDTWDYDVLLEFIARFA